MLNKKKWMIICSVVAVGLVTLIMVLLLCETDVFSSFSTNINSENKSGTEKWNPKETENEKKTKNEKEADNIGVALHIDWAPASFERYVEGAAKIVYARVTHISESKIDDEYEENYRKFPVYQEVTLEIIEGIKGIEEDVKGMEEGVSELIYIQPGESTDEILFDRSGTGILPLSPGQEYILFLSSNNKLYGPGGRLPVDDQKVSAAGLVGPGEAAGITEYTLEEYIEAVRTKLENKDADVSGAYKPENPATGDSTYDLELEYELDTYYQIDHLDHQFITALELTDAEEIAQVQDTLKCVVEDLKIFDHVIHVVPRLRYRIDNIMQEVIFYMTMDLEGNMLSKQKLYETNHQNETQKREIQKVKILDARKLVYMEAVSKQVNRKFNETNYQLVIYDLEKQSLSYMDIFSTMDWKDRAFSCIIPGADEKLYFYSYGEGWFEADLKNKVVKNMETEDIGLYPSYIGEYQGYPLISNMENDASGTEYFTMDPETGRKVQEISFPLRKHYNVYAGEGSGYDLLFHKSTAASNLLYGYCYGDTKMTLLADFGCDYEGLSDNSYIAIYDIVDEERFIAGCMDAEGKSRLSLFTRQEK